MSPTDDLARLLADARRDARLVQPEAALLPGSVADAYAVQAGIAALGAGPVRGWKVTALTATDQAALGVDRPVAGPLFAEAVQPAPGKLARGRFVQPLLECEIAFRLGTDLPREGAPYDRTTVAAAVAAILPAFEVADGRVAADAPGPLRLADAMGNGAFVAGPEVADWQAVDLGGLTIRLTHDDREVAKGPADRILGDPLGAVVALANAQPFWGPGLRAGDIVTTGTCTPPWPLAAGRIEADFGPLGRLTLDVVP
jgi:2-keto-4-pentenoate hydratase